MMGREICNHARSHEVYTHTNMAIGEVDTHLRRFAGRILRRSVEEVSGMIDRDEYPVHHATRSFPDDKMKQGSLREAFGRKEPLQMSPVMSAPQQLSMRKIYPETECGFPSLTTTISSSAHRLDPRARQRRCPLAPPKHLHRWEREELDHRPASGPSGQRPLVPHDEGGPRKNTPRVHR